MKNLIKALGLDAENGTLEATLKKAISGLPEKNQIAIKLHYIDNVSRKEIAIQLNWSSSKVNTKITRGITLLKAELNPDHFKAIDKVIDQTTQRLLRK